jgi:hypothetical protein
MTDFSKMPFQGAWGRLLMLWRQGERFEKREVVALLESDTPLTDEAKPLLAAILRGEVRFHRGTSPRPITVLAERHPGTTRELINIMVDELEREICSNHETKIRGAQTIRENAKSIIANQFGISVRTLETIMTGNINSAK